MYGEDYGNQRTFIYGDGPIAIRNFYYKFCGITNNSIVENTLFISLDMHEYKK